MKPENSMYSDLTAFLVYDQDGNLVAGPFTDFDKAIAIAVKHLYPWEIVQTEYKLVDQFRVEASDNFEEEEGEVTSHKRY